MPHDSFRKRLLRELPYLHLHPYLQELLRLLQELYLQELPAPLSYRRMLQRTEP